MAETSWLPVFTGNQNVDQDTKQLFCYELLTL